MSLPWAVLACPPLLLLYPVSYALRVIRLLLYQAPARPRGQFEGDLVDVREEEPATAPFSKSTGPSAKRVGSGLISYAEDLLIWHDARVAIISSDPGRPEYDPFKNIGDASKARQGQLVCYDLDTGSVWPLQIDGWPVGRTFHPLGIGLVQQSTDGNDHTAILAVVNIGAFFAAVDIVRLTAHGESATATRTNRIKATFVHSLEHPSLTTPNAVLPLSQCDVLVTNSFGISPRTSPLGNEVETILGLPLGCALSLWGDPANADNGGTHSERLASGIPMANGIAASPDGRVVLVASTMATRVCVYDVDPPLRAGERLAASTSDRFRFRNSIPVGFLIDNLRFHAEQGTSGGASYVFLGAGHPATFSYLASAKSKGEKRAGSRVVKISVRQAPKGRRSLFRGWLSELFIDVDACVQTVFEDNGELVSTSATAASSVGNDGTTEMLVTGLWDSRGIVRVSNVAL